MMGYYDVILGLIPASFIGLTALFYLIGLSMTIAVPLGSLAAMGLIGHAMFVRTPVTGTQARSSAHARPQTRPPNAD